MKVDPCSDFNQPLVYSSVTRHRIAPFLVRAAPGGSARYNHIQQLVVIPRCILEEIKKGSKAYSSDCRSLRYNLNTQKGELGLDPTLGRPMSLRG